MPTTTPSIIDQFLIQSTAQPEDFDRFLLSMVFADAAARAKVPNDGNSADPTGPFIDAWSSTLGSLGWKVRYASQSSLNQAHGGFGSTPHKPLGELLAAHASAAGVDCDPSGTLDNLLRADPRGVSSPTRDAMLELWWSFGTAVSGRLGLGFACVSSASAGPTFSLALLGVPTKSIQREHGILHRHKQVTLDGWTSLRTSVIASALDVNTRAVTASIERSAFDKEASQIRQALGTKAARHYVLGTGVK